MQSVRGAGLRDCAARHTASASSAAAAIQSRRRERGSGRIFFGGCDLRCVFCQNYEVSLASSELARRYLGKRVYFEVASRNVTEMRRQVGDLVLDE